MNIETISANINNHWLQKAWGYVAFFCLMSAISLNLAYAKELQSHESLHQFAKEFVINELNGPYKLSVNTGYLDKRVRLDKCNVPLTAFFPSNRQHVGNTTVGIRCQSPQWKIYISIQVKAIQPVLVTRQAIPKGSLISEQDVSFREVDIGRFRSGVFTSPDDIIGMVTKRSIAQDTVLTPKLVRPKRLISRGEPIIIHAKVGNLWIRTEGKALMDGHKGQLIEVKNSRSGKKLMAEVIAPSAVKVKM